MSTSNPTAENDIDSLTDRSIRLISGPYWEPATVQNATTYWRCECCGYESIHEQDLHRESFHAPTCEVRQ